MFEIRTDQIQDEEQNTDVKHKKIEVERKRRALLGLKPLSLLGVN